MAEEPKIAERFDFEIPGDLMARLRATLVQGTVVDNEFVLKIIKQFIGRRELQIFERGEVSQAQARVTQKAEALNLELGLKDLP